MQTTQIAQENTAVKSVGLIAGKFAGMLAAFQLNCFNSLIASGVQRKVAHKVSADYASDVGRLMSKDPKVAAAVGKAKENGEANLRITAAAIIMSSRAMSLLRIAQVMDQLVKEKLIVSRKMPDLNDTLAEYVSECDEWVKAQSWDEKQ